MDLQIDCPKCGARVDVSRRIEQLAASRAREEAERLAAERVRGLEREIEARLKAQAEEQARIQAERRRLEFERSFQEKLQQKDLAISELQKRVLDSQSKAQELEAKLAQGSAQVKGILAETDLYEYLKRHLPADRCAVEKRGQGRKGTDVIVHAHKNGERVGSLIVDDKWAGNWSPEWPEKIWGDMQLHGADFAYVAVNSSAMPEGLREAGFGLAPCRKAGVCVWVVDRSNLPLVAAILSDSVDKCLKLAEVKAVYGAGSEAVRQFQAYLTKGYEIDLREKAKHMSAAVKALNDMYKKVLGEYEKAMTALQSYWATESRAHQSIASCFGADTVKAIPKIPFEKD